VVKISENDPLEVKLGEPVEITAGPDQEVWAAGAGNNRLQQFTGMMP
jgi:hypothetical protein